MDAVLYGTETLIPVDVYSEAVPLPMSEAQVLLLYKLIVSTSPEDEVPITFGVIDAFGEAGDVLV